MGRLTVDSSLGPVGAAGGVKVLILSSLLATLAVLTGAARPAARARLACLDLAPAGPEVVETARRALPLRLLSAAGGGCVALIFGSWFGLILGLLVAIFSPKLASRLEPASARAQRLRLAAELPVAVDLLASCLLAGSAPQQALRVVGLAIEGPVGDVLIAVVGALAVGTDPHLAWGPYLADPGLGRLGRAMIRAELSGSPLAEALDRTARDLRATRRISAEAAARRVGVLAVGPLGACFLPGFVLLGIVPVVWGLAGSAFGQLP